MTSYLKKIKHDMALIIIKLESICMESISDTIIQNSYAHINIHIHTPTHISTYIRIHISTHTHINTYQHIAYTHQHIYQQHIYLTHTRILYKYEYTHSNTQQHTYTYTHQHIYQHTRTFAFTHTRILGYIAI